MFPFPFDIDVVLVPNITSIRKLDFSSNQHAPLLYIFQKERQARRSTAKYKGRQQRAKYRRKPNLQGDFSYST